MSETRLPKTVDPLRLAKLGTQLQGTYPLGGLPRLAHLLQLPEGEVAVDVVFGIDDAGVRFMRVGAKTALTLTCQRCMQPFDVHLDCAACLSPVPDEIAAAKLPERYEALVFDGEPLILADMVEEEILLNLPIAPKHRPEDCAVAVSKAGARRPPKGKNRPFDKLATLTNKRGEEYGSTKES